ncbi:MAG: tRNA-dihydrouridine synthase family protein [Puniceicoccaceae bacterium]|nr:MAG: tRNA-dihydrouridine synthase family protein [Puniceicoccaceae bacterium]
MQDVTGHAFMGLIAGFGPPDLFFTEYFRAHPHSSLEPHILHSIDANPTGRPVFAQIIGDSPTEVLRTALGLLDHPVAGIDLNMGCPAPKVYKKNAGGGLLRDLERVRAIFESLRPRIPGRFTVKMRIGFDHTADFDALLDLVDAFDVDLLSLHARTVRELYHADPHYEFITRAVGRLRCPVLANGNITSADTALRILRETGAAGVMVGRSAIRYPWIFTQIHRRLRGLDPQPVRLSQVRNYIDRLYEALRDPARPPEATVARLKKFLNFVGQGVDPDGAFLHAMRRTRTPEELFMVCDRHLLRPGDPVFPEEPYPGVLARPNRESAAQSCGL